MERRSGGALLGEGSGRQDRCGRFRRNLRRSDDGCAAVPILRYIYKLLQYHLAILNIFKSQHYTYLQLISIQPKLQILTTKTKYLGPFHFADNVNISQIEHLPIFWDSTFKYVPPIVLILPRIIYLEIVYSLCEIHNFAKMGVPIRNIHFKETTYWCDITI